MSNKFNSVLIIGLGLIGSSLARAIQDYKLAQEITGLDNNKKNIDKCLELKIINYGYDNLNDISNQFDLIIIC